MAEELIDQYVDREKFSSDTKFIQDQLKLVYSAYDQLSKVKVDLSASVKGGEVAKNAELGMKATIKLKEETKAYVQTLAARFASEAKLNVIGTNYAKQTVTNRVELQKLNAELKAGAQAELATIGSRERAIAQIKVLTQQKDKLNLVNAAERKQYDEIVVKIERYNKFLKETGTTAEKQKQNIGNYSGAVKILEKELGAANIKLEQLAKEGKQATDAYKLLEKEASLLNQLVGAQTAGFANAAVEIRTNTKALIDLEQAGLKGTQAYKDLALTTGQLKDQLADVKTATANLGSDTFVLDGMIQAAEGLAGAYGAAQGAAALFGDENEDLQKTFVKLQAVMAIVQGLQAVQNALQKENSALLLVQDVRTKALALSQTVYAAAVGTSTGAMRAFRIALLATGIGVVIGLLIAAANAMGVFEDATGDATEEIEKQNEALEKQKKNLIDVIDASEKERNRRKGGLNDLKRELELAEARGESETKLQKIRDQIAIKEIDNFRVRGLTLEGFVEDQKDAAEEIKNIENKNLADRISAEKKANEERVKNAEKAAEKRRETEKRNAQALFNILRDNAEERARLLLKDTEDEKLPLAERLAALQAYKEKADSILSAQKEFDKKDPKLTVAERLEIDNQFAIDSNKNLEEYFERRKQIFESNSELIKEQVQKVYDDLNKAADKTFGQESLNREKSRFAELVKLDEDFAAGRIKSYEDYQNSKTLIDERYDREQIEAEITRLENILALQVLFGKDTLDTEKQILELRKQLYDKDAKNYDDAAKKKEETERRLKDLKKEIANEAVQTFENIVIGQYEKEKNLIQGQIEDIDIRSRKEIEAVNASVATEQEKADKIFIITQRAQAQKEELERRKKRLDYEAAVFQRGIDVAEIVASTAVAVMKAAKTPVLIPFIVALGALQLANVLARPIPRFKDGLDTDYEGFAVVGDGGRSEAIKRADGSVEFTPAKDTLTYIGKGDRIYPSADDWVDSVIAAALRDSGIKSPAKETQKQSALEKEIKGLRKDIRNKKELHIKPGFNSIMALHRYGDWFNNYVNDNTDF